MMKYLVVFLVLFSNIRLSLSEESINQEELVKYKKAYEYILSDSVLNGKDMYVSSEIVDMDRFYFKNTLKDSPNLTEIIESLTKYEWFDDFYSQELHDLFKEQNKEAENIVFFSTIEKNTLRADLFKNRYNLNEFKYKRVIPWEGTYAYLFFFNEKGEIIKVLQTRILYEPY